MCAQHFDENRFTFKSALDAETEFGRLYGRNTLAIFALSLYLRLEDCQEFAASAITEGPDDKKVDFCYVDENEQRAIIAQSYCASTWGKAAAPANKASDLNTAMTWLLSAGEDRIPRHLQTRATELRRLLASGNIRRIEILYIHNCHESQNVEDELKTVADGTRDMANSLVNDHQNNPIIVSYRELGLEGIQELYKARDSDILIDAWMKVPAFDYIEEKGERWRAILTTVPGNWIRKLYIQHSDRLFSANYRDYLGYVQRRGNINYEITQTAESEPVNFWVYNNGITALTHELKLGTEVQIRGISVINGAQTSGALGDTPESSTADTRVLIRIVECRSQDLINKIIRYNNTQNEIRPADTRSNDPTQRRLQADFAQYGITFVHRRSTTRSPRHAITAAAIAPALCSFHGNPQTAFRNAKEIFTDDATYQKVFPTNISIEHVFLVQALSIAIDRVKSDLKKGVSDETATQLEEQQWEVLKYSAAKHFMFFLVGAAAEEIMQRRVSDLHEWKCRPDVISPENKSMANSWETALRALLPQIATVVQRQGKDASYDVPRSTELSDRVAQDLKALIASTPILGQQFSELTRRTTL